jgi:3-oxoacyl-[acyl-carrier-protein] synthase II
VPRQHSAQQRVVVTGLGAVTALGRTVSETWQGLVAGRSGIGEITQFDARDLPIRIAGEVKGFDARDYIPFKEARRMSRCSQLAVAAGLEAMADAGLGDIMPHPERAGVVMGVGIGGLEIALDAWDTMANRGVGRVNPFAIPASLPNMPAHHLSLRFQCQSHSATIVTACASGTQAVGEAAEAIRRGAADLALCGGVEGMIHLSTIAGFIAMRALANDNEHPERACKPFDARRDGFVCSEGSAILLLERLDMALDRGARIYAEILGYAANSDAFHVAQPDPEGAGAIRVMSWALDNAGVAPSEVCYINAHGPGTPVGDPIETRAVKQVFGAHAYQVPMSSTKSMLGHAFGGAGAIEALATVKTVETGMIHPTINYEVPDPECDLDYVPNVARQAEVPLAMSNSFGLGGQNASLVVAQYDGMA